MLVRCSALHRAAPPSKRVPLPPSREKEASNAALLCLGRHFWPVFFCKAKSKKVEVSVKSLAFLPAFLQVCIFIIFRFCFYLEQESFASVVTRNVAWLACKGEMAAEAAQSPMNLGGFSLKKMIEILQNILKGSF